MLVDKLPTYPLAAVLTGDLIGSRRKPAAAVDMAIAALRDAALDIGRDMQRPVVFDRHRGDGWQVLLPEAAAGLRSAMRLVAALTAAETGLSTRIGLGFGPARLVADRDLASAQGAAFQMSGDVLDGLPRQDRIALPALGTAAGPPLQAMTMLLDWESRRWSPGQAAALFEALRLAGPTQEEIAEKFGVSRQAIQMRLAATGLRAVLEALNVFESQIDDVWHSREAA